MGKDRGRQIDRETDRQTDGGDRQTVTNGRAAGRCNLRGTDGGSGWLRQHQQQDQHQSSTSTSSTSTNKCLQHHTHPAAHPMQAGRVRADPLVPLRPGAAAKLGKRGAAKPSRLH